MALLLPEGVDRGLVTDHMTSRGVSTSVHFQPLHTFEWFATHAEIGPSGVGVGRSAWPPGRSASRCTPGLTSDQVDQVVVTLGEGLDLAGSAR